MQCPGIFGRRGHRREPDLPVNARLIWRDEWWPPIRITELRFELVFFPSRLASNQRVICSLKNNFVAFAPYCPECAVSVHEIEGIVGGIHQLPPRGEIKHRGYAEPDHHDG